MSCISLAFSGNKNQSVNTTDYSDFYFALQNIPAIWFCFDQKLLLFLDFVFPLSFFQLQLYVFVDMTINQLMGLEIQVKCFTTST